MREAVSDLFAHPADVRVVPTNGAVARSGALVMGAGVALTAARLAPDLPGVWGRWVRDRGNVPCFHRPWLSWPTKHHWRDPSDLGLILAAVPEVLRLVAYWSPPDRPPVVVLPRLGCGLGGLDWADVGPALAAVLDDRFVVLTPLGGR